jgi:hypothetical protein
VTVAGFHVAGIHSPGIRPTVIDRRYIRNHRRFQQVQGGEFAAEFGQGAEQLQVPGQGQARKVDLQKLCVARTVAGTVEDRVDVEEDG